jgi:hypothetical protein
MAASVGIAGTIMGWDNTGAFGDRLLFLVVMVFVGFSTFMIGSFLLGGPEVRALLRMRRG